MTTKRKNKSLVLKIKERILLFLENRIANLFVFTKMFDCPLIRRAKFKSLDSNQEFQYASLVGEHYVIIPKDLGVSKHVFVDGHFGWGNVEKVFSILGGKCFNTFVDIGANIGTICIPIVKRGFAKKAIAFEPEPKNYRALVANIFLNDLADKVTSYNLALGAESNKKLSFELSNDNSGDHRVKVSNEDGIYSESIRKQITVESEPLDDVLLQIDWNSSLIWIDTQGYEGWIMKGAQRALQNKVPMVVEFWPYAINRANCYVAFKEACLNYNGYYDLSDPHPSFIYISEEQIDKLYKKFSSHNSAYTDLLLI